MATTLSRMYQLIGSAADWAANDIVLGNGEIGFSIQVGGEIWGKIGDGVSTFSALEYVLGNPGIPLSGTEVGKPVTAPIEFDDGVFFRNFTVGQDAVTGDLTIEATGADEANSSLHISINSVVWSFAPDGKLTAPGVVLDPGDTEVLVTKDYVDTLVLGGISSDFIPLVGTGASPVTGIIGFNNATLEKDYNFGILEGFSVDNLLLTSTGVNFDTCSFVINMNDYLWWFMNTGRLIMPDITYASGDSLAAANKKFVDELRQDCIDAGLAIPAVV